MSCYGVLLDPGPGDTLRFLHGFCEMLGEKSETGVVFCTPMACRNISGLFHIVDREITLVKCADIPAMNQRLKELPKSEIWYCYDIKYIDRTTKRLSETVTENTSHEYYMIDRFKDHKYMQGKIATHLQLPELPKKEKALLFLRNMPVCPERNMNCALLGTIVELSKEHGMVYDIIGGGVKEWDAQLRQIQGVRLYPDGYPEYLVQLKEYGSYRFAIGMNSGGLDLAIAAGIPGIRIGEFHQYYSWLGAHYNDFLSSTCTVNIASRSETDVSNIGKQQIQKALEIVLNESEDRIWWI